MDLHEQLRELVAHHGPSVADTAEGFRAALDDFLGEGDASTGELNLLVDAVRLGAVRRLLETLDLGAEPQAAIREAGDVLARDRGTDDPARSRWAVAVLGHALGRMDAAEIPGGTGRRAPVPPGDGPDPAPDPAPGPGPGPRPEPEPAPEPAAPPVVPVAGAPQTQPVPVTREVRTEALATEAVPGPGAGEPGPGTSGRRGGPARMSIGAIALTLVTGIVLVLALLDLGPFADPDDDPGPAARSDESEEPVPSPDEATGPLDDQGALLSDHMLVSVTDETGASRIAAVDTDSGESTTLTEGPGDRLPVLSPDRETLIFLRREGDQAAVPYVVDLASDEQPRPLFAEGHPCSYSGRPAWDLSGERMAVMCTDSAGGFVALHLLDPEGADLATVPLEAIPRGAPTWISPSMLVYTRDGTAGVPSSLWAVDVDTGEETALTADAGAWDSHPDWSEAAGLLLFSRSPVDQFYGELWTLDRAREPARIDVGRPVAHPVWGPGGGSVAVTVRNEDDSESLAIVRTNDPGALEVLELDGEPGVPVWDSR